MWLGPENVRFFAQIQANKFDGSFFDINFPKNIYLGKMNLMLQNKKPIIASFWNLTKLIF